MLFKKVGADKRKGFHIVYFSKFLMIDIYSKIQLFRGQKYSGTKNLTTTFPSFFVTAKSLHQFTAPMNQLTTVFVTIKLRSWTQTNLMSTLLRKYLKEEDEKQFMLSKPYIIQS